MKYFYLLEIQYLGFRFHGWQEQPNVKTIQKAINRTLRWILPEVKSKVLASGRTDALVSVNHTFIELFTDQKIEDFEGFLYEFNINLPQDIKILSIQETDKDFNIIQAPQIKEYHYYFAFGEKFHPFCSPFMCNIIGDLDIEIMQKAAREFVGERDFFSYAFRPKEATQTVTEILSCEIIENKELTASFFPETSYVMKVKSYGFKRNQIRLMMGALIHLGKGEMTWDEFIKTLDGDNRITLSYVAPASGLQLKEVVFQ